jgi:hypothetical protein
MDGEIIGNATPESALEQVEAAIDNTNEGAQQEKESA